MWSIQKASAFLMIMLVCMFAVEGTASAQNRLFLLTPDEAARLSLGQQDQLPPQPVLRGTGGGPRILVQQPSVRFTADGSVIETTPSTRFVINFEPNGAPVNMDSLEIKAKKGILSMSLTPRLKPYIQGTSLLAESVTVPEGRFMIQIEILDTAGAKAVETYRLEVKRVGS